jgi:hypothetical protein
MQLAHRDLPVTVIDDGPRISMLCPQVSRGDVQRRSEQLAIPHEESRALKRDKTGFVEVCAERVGVLVDLVEEIGLSKLG